jgi:hypothetical protein
VDALCFACPVIDRHERATDFLFLAALARSLLVAFAYGLFVPAVVTLSYSLASYETIK